MGKELKRDKDTRVKERRSEKKQSKKIEKWKKRKFR